VEYAEKHTGIKHIPGIIEYSTALFVYNLFTFLTLVLVAHNGFGFDFPCLLSEVSRVRGDTSMLKDHRIHFADSLYHFRQVII